MPDGALTTLIWFDGLNGAAPQAPLLQARDGKFYGTTAYGGSGYSPTAGGGNGVVFQLTEAQQCGITSYLVLQPLFVEPKRPKHDRFGFLDREYPGSRR